ncbi:MAG: RlpA-like double-psi beta-barrel domain-containing protein [Paracraurococcus sp.]
MRRRDLAHAAWLALLGMAPATAWARSGKPTKHGAARRGIAVWYGEDRQGQTMANGRPFDASARTGASVHFPLGTRVRVTDLETRKSVTVTITDTTVPGSRVLIDLSRGAGRALGIETRGKARVEVVPIGFDRTQAKRRGEAGR